MLHERFSGASAQTGHNHKTLQRLEGAVNWLTPEACMRVLQVGTSCRQWPCTRQRATAWLCREDMRLLSRPHQSTASNKRHAVTSMMDIQEASCALWPAQWGIAVAGLCCDLQGDAMSGRRKRWHQLALTLGPRDTIPILGRPAFWSGRHGDIPLLGCQEGAGARCPALHPFWSRLKVCRTSFSV